MTSPDICFVLNSTYYFIYNIVYFNIKNYNSTIMRWVLSLLVLSGSLLLSVQGKTGLEDESKKSPPPFFLQDSTDSLCLAGEEFKRCSIDTLFYVVGAPGE